VVAHAREQAEAGVFMSDAAVDQAVEQCLLLAEPSAGHPLIDTFERRVDEADFLDDAARCFRQDRSFMGGTQNFQAWHCKILCSARHAA
uniref:hypothetical protein n=1 Tax=Ellagibacter isourolithinifaciens TaxID=2137581 RepID=UPI003AB04F00